MVTNPLLRRVAISFSIATCVSWTTPCEVRADGVSIADAPGGGKPAGWTTPPPVGVRSRNVTTPPPVGAPGRSAFPPPAPAPTPTPPPGPLLPAPAPTEAPPFPSTPPPVVRGGEFEPPTSPPAPTPRPMAGARRRAGTAAAADAIPPVTFRFAVGDTMRISIWDDESQTGTIDLEQRVLRDGTVTPIWLEPVRVAGLSIQEVRDQLVDRYLLYYEPPVRITVSVVSVHAERAFILGEVGNPTAVDVSGPTSVLQALAQAGGVNAGIGDLERIKLIRDCEGCGTRPRVYTLNMSRTMVGRGRTVTLQPGDVVYVPTRGMIDWTRDLSAILQPLGNLLGSVGSAATTWLAIDEVRNGD